MVSRSRFFPADKVRLSRLGEISPAARAVELIRIYNGLGQFPSGRDLRGCGRDAMRLHHPAGRARARVRRRRAAPARDGRAGRSCSARLAQPSRLRGIEAQGLARTFDRLAPDGCSASNYRPRDRFTSSKSAVINHQRAAVSCFRLDKPSRATPARLLDKTKPGRPPDFPRATVAGEREHVRPPALFAQQTRVRYFVLPGCGWLIHVRRD